MDLYGPLLRHVLFPGFEAIRRRPTLALLRTQQRTQWASQDELHAIQSSLLRRLIRHAYDHTDYFRQVMTERGLHPEDIRHPEDLARLPLLDKETARTRVAERTAKAPPFAVVHKATSGSTGEPFVISYNAESRHWRDATRWRGYGWAGYEIGQRALHYWGFGAQPPKNRFQQLKVELDHRLKRDLYVDCSPRGDSHLADVVGVIQKYRPEVIVTYSQAGAALARYVNRTGRRTWPTIPVICGAERVFPNDRAALVEAFGPAVFETYGAREFMLIGAECEAHDGLHTSMETMIVELVVREADGTVRPARPGESGEFAITDLHNLAVPFIRYLIGDLGTEREPAQCTCGRWLHRVGPIDGRIAETLRDGAGNPVNGLIFNILFVAEVSVARQFQAIQHADGRLTLKVVPSSSWSDDARAKTLAFLAKYLPGVDVTIALVDDIPTTAAGKRKLVIVER